MMSKNRSRSHMSSFSYIIGRLSFREQSFAEISEKILTDISFYGALLWQFPKTTTHF